MSSLYTSSISGLQTASLAMNVASNNIAGASKPGYAKQSLEIASAGASLQGGVLIGNGVLPTGVSSSLNQQTEIELSRALGRKAYSTEMSNWRSQIEQTLSPKGLADKLNALQSTFTQAAGNGATPADVQAIIGAATDFAQTARGLSEQGGALKDSLNHSIEQYADSANGYLQQIAQLNNAINQYTGSTQSPNELIAQRWSAFENLSSLTGASSYQTDEGLSVVIGNSVAVNGAQAQKLSVDVTSTGIQISLIHGSTPMAVSGAGGQIGGALSAYKDLTQAINSNDAFSAGVARTINQQLLNGTATESGLTGTNLFSFQAGQVTADPKNTGNALISSTPNGSQNLSSAQLTLAFDGTQWTATTDNGVGQISAGMPMTVGSIQLNVTGTATAGDRWLIEPYSGASQTLTAAPFGSSLGVNEPKAAQSPSGKVSISTTNPSAAGYALTGTLSFSSATSYSIAYSDGTNSGPQTLTGSTIQGAGWHMNLAFSPTNGTQISFSNNSAGSPNGINAQNIANILAGKSFAGQSATESSATQIARLGAQSKASAASAQSESSIAAHVSQLKESQAGVNLDEEAANLIKWQQAYSANAKALNMAQSLFQTFLNSIN